MGRLVLFQVDWEAPVALPGRQAEEFVRDMNLSSWSGGLPQAVILNLWQPPLVALVRRAVRQIATMIEDKACQLGLNQFRSCVRDHDVSDELRSCELDAMWRRAS